MWYVKSLGNVEGPLSDAEVEKRIKLNMLRSLDQISQDGLNWNYLKNSKLWQRPAPELKKVLEKTPAAPPPVYPNVRLAAPQSAPPPQKPRTVPLVAGIAAAIAIAATAIAGAWFFIKPSGSAPAKNQIFANAKDKLAIIACDGRTGSGFIASIDGKKYLVTNEHVIRGVSAPQAKLLDGTALKLGAFAVATDRDLARFELPDCKIEPLEISNAVPDNGDEVFVYGNSRGEDVITESKGTILGVGPVRIETDAEIVEGNSGGPIMAHDAKVLAVSTLMKKDESSTNNWTLANTRYDNAVRRFGLRLANVQWKEIDRDEYECEVANLQELKLYLYGLVPFLRYDTVKEINPSVLEFTEGDKRLFRNAAFADILSRLSPACAYDQKLLSELAGYDFDSHDKELDKRDIDENKRDELKARYFEDFLNLYERRNATCGEVLRLRSDALELARNFIAQNSWETPQIKDGRDNFDIECVRFYLRAIKEEFEILANARQNLRKNEKEVREWKSKMSM